MGNFTGKEGVDGDQKAQAGNYGIDQGSRTEPGRPGGFEFQYQRPDESAGGDGMDVDAHRDDVAAEEELVPTVFRWEHGGRQVYITGTFNNWEKQIQMHRSGNDFTYIHNLKKGKHAFKFIVDDEWRFAPDQPTVADIEGRINNFIDVSDFQQAYTGDDDFLNPHKEPAVQNEIFTQVRPELEEYTKEPPPLPPHLRHIILNKVPPVNDAAALSIPQHVALNHLYCTAIKDGMMVLGITQRYREKFVTCIYYSNL
mmetsp:Transcript_13165/g.23109  ORF Transcript_13165/g.23109 Transcript_13165/m.23109 type:complete len:255 (-) Transcript_13165:359-1123(-)